MENPYGLEPLQITLYDVTVGTAVRSYMLLGNVPRGVLAAAQRGAPAPTMHGSGGVWPLTEWSEADAATLHRYYGAQWQKILTPRVGVAQFQCEEEVKEGGGPEDASAFDFGDLDDFDDANIVIEDGQLADTEAETAAAASARGRPPDEAEEGEELAGWDPRTVYSDFGAYPEDTFADLKAKIHAVAGVPPYRQHLFFAFGDDAPSDTGGEEGRPTRTTYRITVEGAHTPIDVRRFSQDLCAARGGAPLGPGAGVVAEIPIDRRLEERKDDIRVDALDDFHTLEEPAGVFVRRVFVADLATLLRSRGAAIRKAFTDRYQFDLLYYGAILKYWPILSPEAFRLAVANPPAIAATFPQLDPPLDKVRERLRVEQRLIDRVYARAKALQSGEQGANFAITAATVHVRPRGARMAVNVRNIFDWIPATPVVPAIIARIPPADVEGRSDSGARLHRRDYTVEKTHISAAGPRLAPALERFRSRPPRTPGVAYAVAREGAPSRARGGPPQLASFTIYGNGRYSVESAWREDDRVDFDEMYLQLTAAVQPIIESLAVMGAAAFPLGGDLETPKAAAGGVSSRASIGALTISAFWPHALTSEGFREAKARWREYEKAGITGVRGLQQFGVYTFYFRKGITGYDPRAMERVVTQEAGTAPTWRQVVTNHYAHLTDPVLAQRWGHVYAGRLVRVYHRTTDLRVEFVGVDAEEFRRIYRYTFTLLDGLLHGPGRLAPGLVGPEHARPSGGRLRGLQERDPDLFDLKKFDEGATVYSVLCQGDRQPEIITEAEARGWDAKKRKSLVRYWNFSEGRPALYRCPSKRYPHLSFRMGVHPLGYCLPCCKKTPVLAGSKAQAAQRHCLKLNSAKEGFDGEEASATTRHVLAYGKPVPVGRISHAPRPLVDGLFYNTIPPPYVYRLVGVTQQTPGLPKAGFFYAMAAALMIDPEELVRGLAETANVLEATYRSLGRGGAAAFASVADLVDALVRTFGPQSGDGLWFSPFGPGGAAAETWRALIADLILIRYAVDVVEFVDAAGTGDVVLEASQTTVARIRASGGAPAGGVRRADSVLADVAVLVTNPEGTYPFVAMKEKAFLRHVSGRVRPARWFFSSDYPETVQEDRVVETLYYMVVSQVAPEEGGPLGAFNLDFVTELCAAEGYRILYRLINLRDMCYGVVLAPAPGKPDLVYFPVPYSPHYLPPPGTAETNPHAIYGPRPAGSYPAQALAKVLAAANRRQAGLARGSRVALVPTAHLETPGGEIVGFLAAPLRGDSVTPLPGSVGEYFHHDPVAPGGDAVGLPWATTPKALIPYAMADIDQAIYEAGGAPDRDPLSQRNAALARRGVYHHHLYRLFLAEFAALLQGERNETIRAELKSLFARTRFGSPRALADLRGALARHLRDYPDDADTIRGLVGALYSRLGPELHLALLEEFDATTFDFDHTTLHRLRALGDTDGRGAVEAELARLMRDQVDLDPGAAEQNDDPINMYVACLLPSQVGRPQCTHGRLRVPLASYPEYISILTADILNPLKVSTLGTLTAGIIHGDRFMTRPDEKILVR